MKNAAILENINIPQTPGCYIFKDSKEKIIYVGKSKYLPKRVKSYFQKNHDDIKTIKLVEKIRHIEFIICESESEALVTEENLIKLYQPDFNIKGKDDKTTRLVLTVLKESYPRIELLRNTECGENEILGLFTSSRTAREVYDLVHEIFPLRSCSYNLTRENIELGKFKPCLESQIENCLAPCSGFVNEIIYRGMISLIRKIFNFDYEPARKDLKRKMYHHSKKLEYEKAHDKKRRLESLELLIKKIEPLRLNNIKKGLENIQSGLKLSQTPLIIEAFDNSHTSGTETVSASVRYVMGMPEKSSYRKFIIRSGSGADDYASFSEVLHRRFKRLTDEKTQLPNLIIIDGARSQLMIGIGVLRELKILDKVDIISISKDKTHRPKTIHLKNNIDIPILDCPNHEILANISEEIHRFVITFHRQRRDKIK